MIEIERGEESSMSRFADHTALIGISRYNSEAMALDFIEMRTKAEAGSCVAQGVLGTCFLYGIQTEVNYAEAFRWLSAAAEQRASRPTLHLAYMYQQGLGTPVNAQRAIQLFTAVATPSNSTDAFAARIELARTFAKGVGVPVDQLEALRWYSAAIAIASEDDEAAKVEEAKTFIARLSG